MAKHETTFGFADEPALGNKGMVLTVKQDGEIMGHLMIGKASLVWFDKNAKKKGHKVSWADLQLWMQGIAESDQSRP